MKREFKDILFTLTLTFALSLVFSSCSDDDLAASPKVTDPLDELLDKYAVTGTMARVENVESGVGDDDIVLPKSQLYFDRTVPKMYFNWMTGDKIGIFDTSNEKDQFGFNLDDDVELITTDASVTGAFIPSDGALSPISGNTTYHSYFPFKTQGGLNGDFTYHNVPLSFRGQTQTVNEQMNCYWESYYAATADERTTNKNTFIQSSKDASAHLGAYDYLVSTTTATAGNHVHFKFARIPSIIRFYMYSPSKASDDVYYDSLQVYNSVATFPLEATIDVSDPFEEDGVTPKLTPKTGGTSHVISLAFYPALDMTNASDRSTPEKIRTSNYWYQRNTDYGYIMAYMMMPAVDLSEESLPNSTLYMLGRKPSYYTYDEYKDAKKDDSITPEEFNALDKVEKIKIYETMDAYNAAVNPDVDAAKWATMTNIDKMKDYTPKVYKATLSKLKLEAGKHHQWSVASAPEDEPITFEEITIQQWADGPGFTNENGTGTEDW